MSNFIEVEVIEELTIRDHFAMAAMQGILTSLYDSSQIDHKAIAEQAYDMADAMLAERAKRNEN